MGDDLKSLVQLSEFVAGNSTQTYENWTHFLQFAGRFYKYNYDEQLGIYIQRPDATAVASVEIWVEKMHRYVKKESVGIAVIDNSGDKACLRYLFDIADTGTRANSRTPNIWKMRPEHEQAICQALEQRYDVPSNIGSLENHLELLAVQTASEYWEENHVHIAGILDDSALAVYDTDALGDGFRRALSNSVLYQLISRCFGNPDDYLGFEDLSDVLDFNTPQTAIALGTAVSTISSEVLRQIEITVRSYDRNRERSQHYEKPTDLYPQRGLSDSGHQTGERGTAAPEQIRTDAPNLSEGPQSDAVQHPGSEPETLPASSGDSENRRAAIESDNGGASETESRTGQSHESDGLGTAHEQPESPGRGDDLRGVDLQLIADKPSDRGEQLSFFASEYEQIRMIDEAERVVATHSAFSMPQDYIDQFLRYGSNTENQRTQIVIEFSKQKPVEQLIPFLKKTYHGGYGMNFDGTKVSAWYSDEGMRIAYGSTARYARNAQVVTWEAVAGRIDVLLEQGQFATNAELAENRNFETKQLANQLWYMAHDMSKPAADAGYMDIVQSLPGGFPEGTERLTSLLSESYPFILEQVAAFRNAYLLDRSLMRFPMYNPQRMLHSLEEYHLPRREYTSTLTELPTEKPFITEDEINEHLTKGSGFSGSRDRIYTSYQVSHTGKEKQDFLKNEYGIGGGNNALSGNFHSSVFTDGRGIRFEKPNCTRIEIPWPKVVKYYDALAEAGKLHPLVEIERNNDPLIDESDEESQDFADANSSIATETMDSAPATEPLLPEAVGNYRLLDRLRSDCEYFLGAGNRAEKHLWAGSVRAQITKMRELYDTLPEKPEWLTKEAIDDYAERMAPPYQVVAYHHFENGFDDKLDYQTLAEAEKAAQGYVDGTMESDGFAHDGAAIYDRQTRKYLRVYGNYPDEWAQAEAAGRDWVEEPAVSTESAIAPADRFHVVSLDHGFYTRYAIWDDKTDGYYVDTNGVTEEFTSEWQAEEYRLKLQNQALMEQAKGLISDSCQSEYSSEADFSDPAKIGIAYTTITDDEIPIQVNIDLVNLRLERYLNGEHLETRQYGSLQDLIANELEILDFGDLIHVSDEDIEQYRWHNREEATEKASETVDSASSTQKGNLSYSVGDTVYLDNKPFEITEVGLFDVHLRDPSQTYPIFRVENKERLPALLRRDERNAHLFAAEVSEQEQPATKPVMFYPADKTHLPYDVVIQTLHIPEPEHDPPAAEPAELEAPAMSEEEKLILEHEGQAALSEMGEFTPDPDDAISRAEIDEPPALSPAVSIPIDGQWQEFPSVSTAEKASYADFKAASHRNAQNFHITDNDLGAGGAKAKFQANLNAIQLLKHLEAEGLQASPEQQQILSRYVGWGGLPDAFDESKPGWASEYQALKAALTPEEYTAARASTLNAHYTSPTVIRAIYEAVGNLGFQTGNILEPSMGIGNFFGMLPENMRGSRLYGVELDSITGRIAKQLYPKANITIAGFETTDRRDFFDLAVGNVPFGQYKVNDPVYNKLGFNIHNYFFAKTLDQVRPGGVVAFVTSRYTMDAQNPSVRKYLAQRADMLGAIRLPNTAFKANAGTEVVSDVLFLQKRDRAIDKEPDWVHLGQTEDGYAINSYFLDHPEMVIGRNSSESTAHGMDYTVEPLEDTSLAAQLHEAVQHIRGTYQEAELPDLGESEEIRDTIPADPDVKNFSYALVDGEVYFRENSVMVKPQIKAAAKDRIRGMIGLRDCVRELIDLQMNALTPDAAIQKKQVELSRIYDSFSEEFGLINSKSNRLAFSDDSSYYLLCSLEVLDEENKFLRKADMFTKRTIRQAQAVISVDTASEALAVSIAERAGVDMSYMSQLSGKTEETLASELRGVIFRLPDFSNENAAPRYVTADEYLSGNVRKKLSVARLAAENDAVFQDNVEALEKAQPKDLDASEIDVQLGATWIDKRYIQEFMEDLLKPPIYLRFSIKVSYSEYTAEWNISGKKNVSFQDVNANTTYGTSRINAYQILQETLNLRDVRVYDTVTDADNKEKRILNQKETTLAQQKQQIIKDAFRNWIWKDPERRQTLVKLYNEKFNSDRPREYDGSHIRFNGMSPEISLRDHQKNAIAHILYGGNTLLAHEVGSGKTFEMVAAAMESKRLGLCSKSLIVVPNHLIEQWASEFLRLYPSANILVARKKDFEPANRKTFCSKIATGEYDAVIIGHSQFEKIPMSVDRQKAMIERQIDEIEEGIDELQANRAERSTVKSLERTKRSLENRLEKLLDGTRKDDVVTFEELGVDRLFVDEAHGYKNLFLYTKMQNVAGISTTDAKKSSDMYMKCQYLDEKTGGRGIIFATGTPISNSMTELYTMMRYLQSDTLREKGWSHFDCWAAHFGETKTVIELAPEGTGYRARTRFARFHNLPELINIWMEAADVKTADQLHLPRPEAVYHNEVTKPTEVQQALVKELSRRAAAVHRGVVDPRKDNMLKITSDGRKLGLDQRIISPYLPDEPGTKINMCVENVLRIWREGEADKLTQLVFCDISTPRATSTPKESATVQGDAGEQQVVDPLAALNNSTSSFTAYDDIRSKLIAGGIPPEQIAFIHDANTEVRKKELFAKVRTGQVRVLMGSTFKMGAGMNVQDRLIALHDLDCPWRPGDLEQRSGRIIRQGNRNKQVHIYRYVTEGTFDSYLWQTVENKQKFISQIMTSKSPVRSCEDVDETALSFAEIKALCAGNPLIKEKMDLDIEVSRLKVLKADHLSQQYRLEDNLLKYFPEHIQKAQEEISGLQTDIELVAAHPHPKEGISPMSIYGKQFTDKEAAGTALLKVSKAATGLEPIRIGSYRGFEMSVTLENFGKEYILYLTGALSHKVELGEDARGNLIRIDNVLNDMTTLLNAEQNQLENLQSQMEFAKAELGKPFIQEEELAQKNQRLVELNALLDMDCQHDSGQENADKSDDDRPSVLDELRRHSEAMPPHRKSESRNMEERA